MTNPKKPETQSEELVTGQSELSDEELEGLAGGIMIPGGGVGVKMNQVTGDVSDQLQKDASATKYAGGARGTSFPKTGITPGPELDQ